MRIVKIAIDKLLPHEEVNEEHVKKLMKAIKKDGCLIRPIVISKLKNCADKKFLIHDGHHRVEALKKLGIAHVVANLVDFFDNSIKVVFGRKNAEIKKEKIIEHALKNKKFPPKTTKHILILNGKEMPFHENDFIQPKLFVKLEELNAGH